MRINGGPALRGPWRISMKFCALSFLWHVIFFIFFFRVAESPCFRQKSTLKASFGYKGGGALLWHEWHFTKKKKNAQLLLLSILPASTSNTASNKENWHIYDYVLQTSSCTHTKKKEASTTAHTNPAHFNICLLSYSWKTLVSSSVVSFRDNID